MTNTRINIHISPDADAMLNRAVEGGAANKGAVVDAAIKELLDPKRKESAQAKMIQRLDRLTRAMEKMADEGIAQSETLALFVLYYLCITPPLPETARPAAEAVGRKRFDHFIAQVGQRLVGKERYTDAILASIDLLRTGENDEPQATSQSRERAA